MRRRCGLLVASVALLAASANASTPALPNCALGPAAGAERTIEVVALAAATQHFDQTLHGVSTATRRRGEARFEAALAAYLYGFPIVIHRRTVETFPRNQMVSIGTLATAGGQAIVAPNHDTLYSVARIDLSTGPIVITTPPTGGRYSVIQLNDAFTNALYLGDGRFARTGEAAVVVPPGYNGSLPAGLRVVRPASKLVLLLGRTLAAGPADTAAAVGLLRRYRVTPLGAYLSGTRTPPIVLAKFPSRPPVTVPADARFFDELGSDLAFDPAPVADRCALRAFAAAGIGPGRTPSRSLTGVDSQALRAAAAAGRGVLNTIVAGVRHAALLSRNGWTTTPPDTARFGAHYLDRAIVGAIGLEANTNAKALYLTEDRDSARRSLSGGHVYRVHFARGQLPPVDAFWSLTLYDSRILFYANPLNRYSIGNRTAGLRRDHDGGLTITVSHRAPASAAARANWLPAPAGGFSLYLRLYDPKPAAVSGQWVPPAVLRR